MKRSLRYFVVLLAYACAAAVLCPSAASAQSCEKWAGKVISAQGIVQVKRQGQAQWHPVRLNEPYCPGDTIRTEKKSRAEIALSNHPVMRLDQNTTLTLGGTRDEKTSIIDLINGAALFFSRVSRNLEVRTATVNAGVEGTEFYIKAGEDTTELSVFEGKVLASNSAGSIPVVTGQSAVAEKGRAPVHRIVVSPRDAVRWALYYPPAVYHRPADFRGFPESDWRSKVMKSAESYRKGDLAGAFSSIEGVPDDMADPRFFTYRASLLLAVGRVDDAVMDIARAQKLKPGDGDAYALGAVIAVARNDKAKASELSRKAVEADPKSPSARIAMSYAQQAGFDLHGAMKSVREAVKLGPENALAWARLAELHQSFGERDRSLEAAGKAAALDPDLSRTQTVLGFSRLARVETREARAAFEKAIRLDDADPLPRLGLGLSMIRDGKLEEGRREIEIAASLDPDSSIMRSYLGKAYFEEKRDPLAMGQFDMAKKLDPSDPTSFFYDAIRKQTVNRPVEALRDMGKAIELNDNRAVYRSRLLLDEDLAARSASLGRIYGDLGFQQRALVEGWKSLDFDPANHSAHRFLSDSYAALPRHEIARVSELLQSQLLQPLNINPVQPRLAESNSLVVSGGGPADLSFNEFNPLFNRDRAALLASGMKGEDGTNGGEAVFSAVYRKASLSMGHSRNETDGFRVNNDSRDDISNVFLQASLTPATSAQFEYRNRRFEIGDIELRFLNDFSADLRQDDKAESVRLGFHHAFSPGSSLLGSFMRQTKDSTVSDQLAIGIGNNFSVKTEQRSWGGEIQHIYRSESFNLVAGAGYFDIDGRGISDFVIFDPDIGPIPFPTDIADLDNRHLNVYVYSYLNYLRNLTITAGASYDDVESDLSDTFDKKQFNPKLGIKWSPFPDTTLRAAAFKTLKRTLITNQTLEPTQVAGFNQFFDDLNSTESWRYGAAVDRRFRSDLFGGLEFSKRDLEFPAPVSGVFPSDSFDGEEQAARAYLYLTPRDWLSLSVEHLYERFESDINSTPRAKTLDTRRTPLGVGFFHPSGLTATVKATYFDQKGSFLPQGSDPLPENFVEGKDSFWLCDAAVGYRLPRRLGMLTVGARNLFDKSFRFHDTDTFNPAVRPARLLFARITLSF